MDKAYLDDFMGKIDGDKEAFLRFFGALRGGTNSVFRNQIAQSVVLDDDWVLKIEGTLHSIEQIVHNPRKFIAENEIILDVERVRRTNAKTVRHLTMHSQFIQNIDEEGEVKPKKLLTGELEEDIAIYENRFICALVNRVNKFVEIRYKELEGKRNDYELQNVNIKSAFEFGENKYKCDINMQIMSPPEDRDESDRNKDLFDRIETVRRRLRSIKATEFMRKLEKAKPVRPPIQKTNLLVKNVDYNYCYKLWMFLSAYTALGYSVEVQDKFIPVENDYYDDLTVIAGLSLQSLVTNNVLNKDEFKKIRYSEPEVKDYEILKSFTYNPEFEDNKQQSGEESINEYYFRKMKGELVAAAQEGQFELEDRLNVNFTKFFRSISRINDAMYNELIEDQIESNSQDRVINSILDKKRSDIKDQKERIRRRKLYLKLKWEEVERAQRMLERAQGKLDKLEKDLVEYKANNRPTRIVRKKLTTIRRTKKN